MVPKLKLLGLDDAFPVLAAPKMFGFAASLPVAPAVPLPAGVPKENGLDPVPGPACAAPPDACFPPNRLEPLDAGVLLDGAPPKRLEPPPVTAPKRGLDAGVFEPVLVLFVAFPNKDGVDAPEVLPAPKRGCFGVLLAPPDPKVNPDIS